MSINKKERLVAAIENGTVIDHIPYSKALQVVNLLGLQYLETPITIGFNYPSKKLGRKGIIKISDKFFTDDEISKISIISPNVILNIIRNFEVVEKKTVVTPSKLKGIVRCNNPKCITNNEPMKTIFDMIEGEHTTLRCHYCDVEQDIDKVKLV